MQVQIFNKLDGVHKKKASKFFENAGGVIVAGMCILMQWENGHSEYLQFLQWELLQWTFP